MHRRNVNVLFLTLGLACCGAGCAHDGGSTDAGAAAAEHARAETLSAVERSSLREQALSELERAAFSEWAELRANALEGLSYAPARAAPVLRAGLVDDNEGVRAVAGMLVGRLKLQESAPALRSMLDDPNPLVRTSAIGGLAMLGETIDQSPLASMLDHERADVRSFAAYVLGEIGNPSAVPVLRASVRGIGGSAPGATGLLFRIQAAEAQVKLGEREPLNALRAALYPREQDELEGSVLASQILGELKDQQSAKQLAQLVETTFGEPPARGPRQEQRDLVYLHPVELRLAAATALVKLGYEPSGYIGRGLEQDANPMIRAQCAFYYGAIGDPERLERLGEMLADAHPLVRVSASSALVRALSSG